MAVKRTEQLGFADLAVSRIGVRGGSLDRFSVLVKWYRFEKVLKSLRDDGAGRPAYPALVMFKALLLQSLYGLSDAELEEALCDRISFRRFIGLSLEERVPDHTTLCRFRNLLTAQGLQARLFAELDRQLEAAGLMMKRGTMLDAMVADALIRGDEQAVYADSAYHTHQRERALKARGIEPRLMRRANRHHPQLPTRLKRLNRPIARVRAGVETTFATQKRRMKLTATRYLGLTKAAAQVTMAAIAFNLRHRYAG